MNPWVRHRTLLQVTTPLSSSLLVEEDPVGANDIIFVSLH